MLGIHTVYTSANRKDVHKIHDMMQFESITMILSALFWKKFQGRIKLYCDKYFYQYIQTLGVSDLWDEIDTDTLSQLDSNVNHDTFWAYSKMYINSIQTEPFVSLDIDLFQTEDYDYSTHDVIFLHKEKTDSQLDLESNFNKVVTYPNYHKWDLFGKIFSKYPKLNIDNEAANVAMLAINNPKIYKDFFEFIKKFIINNWFDPTNIKTHQSERILNTIHSSSLMTFVEQRMFLYFINYKNYASKSVINQIYDVNKREFINDKGMINPGITHLWGWKVSYRNDKNKNMRLLLTDALISTFKENFKDHYERYIIHGNVLKHCKK